MSFVITDVISEPAALFVAAEPLGREEEPGPETTDGEVQTYTWFLVSLR